MFNQQYQPQYGACQPGPQPMGPSQPAANQQPMQQLNVPVVAGYENTGNLSRSIIPPTSNFHEVQQPNSQPEQFSQGVQITENEARDCLLDHVASQCCTSRAAANGMAFSRVQSTSVVHYVLRTYYEARATIWATESYTMGRPVDGVGNGVPPQPWDIQVPTPKYFSDKVVEVKVPHTETTGICLACQGKSMICCHSCCGSGFTPCNSCEGTGLFINSRCNFCNGSGRRGCNHCNGTGHISCGSCAATGYIKRYIKLIVEFKTHTGDFILEQTPLPRNLIREVKGTTLFEDTQPYLYPVRSFPEPEVNRQSEALIQQHRQLAQSGRIWMQNHVIRGVPVFQCDCSYNGRAFRYFVYGNERKVYAPDYPDDSCCQLL